VKKWEIYLEDRAKGMKYREIAAKHGVSYQAVAQVCAARDEGRFRPFTEEECAYPNLRNWLNENRVMRNELARRMFGYTGGKYTALISNWISGRNYPTKVNIDKLMSITGLTYEQLFSTDDSCCARIDPEPLAAVDAVCPVCVDDLDKKIILALADYNMNEAQVARKMYMHRNSVVYHLHNVRDATGLDPENFYDLAKLVEMVKGEENAAD
jgi:transcriptional regulator with XRE-family HTH domain